MLGQLMQRAKEAKVGEFSGSTSPTSLELPGFGQRFSDQINPLPMLSQGVDVVGKAWKDSIGPGIGLPFTLPYEAAKQGWENLKNTGQDIKQRGIPAIPVVGPLAEDVYHGNWSGMGGDVTGILTQIFGPKVLAKAINIPTSFVGDKLYESGMKKVINRNPAVGTLNKLNDVMDFAKQNEVLPTDVSKVNDLANQASQGKTNEIWNARNKRIPGIQVAQPLMDLAKNYLRAGEEIPPQMLEKINQLQGMDMNVPQWEAMKEANAKLIKSGSPTSGIAIQEKSPLTQIREAAQAGMKQEIQKQAPNVETYNTTLHHSILLRDALEDYLQHKPEAVDSVAPLLAGATTAELAGGSGVHTQPITRGGIAAYLARAAVRNPQVAAKLGVVLSHAGYGPASQSAAALLRLGLVAPKSPPLTDIQTGKQE